MPITNPCGLSVQDVSRIIKENVLAVSVSKKDPNKRGKILKALMNDNTLNLNFSEAKQVVDYYFSVYNKSAAQSKTSAPIIHLNAEQKSQRQVNNMVLDYLSGKTGGVPLTDADIKHLEGLYQLSDKAATPSLKAKFDEQANVFISKFMPTYTNELFRSSVYARPLLSAIFFIKSFTSNFHAQVERGIANSVIWDGKKLDLHFLFKFDGLANATLLHTLRGGIPATTIAHNEQFDFSKGRLEEFDFKGTSLEHANFAKKGYYGIMKFYTKWSNRFNAAPDTRGIYSNAERHFYELLKEKYRDLGLSRNDATQKALKDMELDDLSKSADMAKAKFTELGLPLTNKNGKPTSEFKVAVQEYMRLKRDHVMWGRALELSKNDFWKKNMTVASAMGFGDYGLFGLKAQAFSALKNKFEQVTGSNKTKGKLSSALQLYAFGFLNGAANFAEDAIERFPAYGFIKLLFLQAKKGQFKETDRDLFHDIARRQKDIIVKTFTTALFFAAAKMVENLICGDKKDKQSSSEISSGFSQIGPCGIPVLVPPQMMAMYKFYNICNQAVSNDEEFLNTALNILPVMVQSNDMGLGGSFDKAMTGVSDYAAAKKEGNDVRADEALSKFSKSAVRSVADVANSYLPLPSRAFAEVATLAERIQGKTQRQQELPMSVDDKGSPKGLLNSMGKALISSLGNVTGIHEIILAGFGSDKPYAMDWQGRKVVQLRGSDLSGNGIQYNNNDQLLIDAGVQSPYVSRTSKIEYKETAKKEKGFLPNSVLETTKQVRYMSDDEFYNVSKALGDFNKDYFEKNYDKIQVVLEKDKALAKKQIETVFTKTKAKAIEAVEAGINDPGKILTYIKSHWESRREQKVTETTY